MAFTKRNKQIVFVTAAITAVVCLFLFAFPSIADAAKVYEVLDPDYDSSIGDTVRQVWQSLLYVVNGLIIVVLIFIAFANILRININTYGIKKFLPTLIFAVIAANFSYLFCRVIIDFSNAVMHLLAYGGGGIDPNELQGVSTSFKFSEDQLKVLTNGGTEANWVGIFKVLIYTLFEIAGAILIFILGLLFYIRNYVIYFLVALSSLAFMAMILPQTKSLFNQWLENLLKWAFLPAISLFWLWVGGMWYKAGLDNSGWQILTLVFSGVCYYFAITTPFKIGGSLWGGGAFNWQKDAGKKAWGATGGKVVDYRRAKAQATWQARWNNVQNAVKMKTGWGTALDRAQQKLADSETRRAGLSDEAKGKYIEDRGIKRALWDVKNKALQGNVEHQTAIQLGEALKDPVAKEEIRNMRTGSQIGMAQMEIAEAYWKESEADLKKMVFQGKNSSGEKVAEQDANGNWIAVRGKEKEFKERQAILDQYGSVLWNANLREAEATKEASDKIENVVTERQQLDNAQTKFEDMEEMNKSLAEMLDLMKKEGRRGFDEEKRFKELKAMYKARGYDIPDSNHSDPSATNALQTEVTADFNQAKKNRDKALKTVTDKLAGNGNQMPSYLSDMVVEERDANGNKTGNWIIEKREGLEKSRMGKWLQTEVMSSGTQQVLDSYSGEEQISSMLFGNKTENITEEEMRHYFSGNVTENKPGKNEKIQRFVRAAASKMGNRNNPESQATMAGLLNVLEQHNNNAGVQRIARTARKQFIDSGGDPSMATQLEGTVRAKDIIDWAKDEEKHWKAAATAVLGSRDLGLRGNGPSNL